MGDFVKRVFVDILKVFPFKTSYKIVAKLVGNCNLVFRRVHVCTNVQEKYVF